MLDLNSKPESNSVFGTQTLDAHKDAKADLRESKRKNNNTDLFGSNCTCMRAIVL